MRIMVSVHYGDSVGHLVRMVPVTKKLLSEGHEVLMLVSERSFDYLDKMLPREILRDNKQTYGFSRMGQFESFKKAFITRTRQEYEIYKSFNPSLVIGDMGLCAAVYACNTQIAKCINRFFLEISIRNHSTLSDRYKRQIRTQIEELINESRLELGIKKIFVYEDFLTEGTIFVNGLPSFIGNVEHQIVNTGLLQGMQMGIVRPDNDVAIIFTGTGHVNDKIGLLSMLVKRMEGLYRKLYIAIGRKYSIDDVCLSNTMKIVVEPGFETFPSDVGAVWCHGGYGTVQAAIVNTLPLYCFPSKLENFTNAMRAQEMGLGHCASTLSNSSYGLNAKMKIEWDLVFKKLHEKTGKIEKQEQYLVNPTEYGELIYKYLFS